MKWNSIRRLLTVALALAVLMSAAAGAEAQDTLPDIEELVPEIDTIQLEDIDAPPSDAADEEAAAPVEAADARVPDEDEYDDDYGYEDDYESQEHSIVISGNSKYTMNVGDTLNIEVSGKLVDSWKSSRKSVAECDFDGFSATVYANKEGSSTLTAKLSNRKKITVKLTVKDPYVPDSISFAGILDGTDDTLEMAVGESLDLSAFVEMRPNYANASLSWSTSSSSVAKVDKEGYVTARKPGKAKITVTTKNKKKATLRIKVLANKAEKLHSKPNEGDIMDALGGWSLVPMSVEMKSNGSIACGLYLVNGTEEKCRQIEDMALFIAVGDQDNRVAEYTFEKVKVSCSKNRSKSFKVTFPAESVMNSSVFFPECAGDLIFGIDNPDEASLIGDRSKDAYPFIPGAVVAYQEKIPVEYIELNEDTVSLAVGKSITLKATVEPADATDRKIKWSSSNTRVATVKNGVVKAVAAGEAVIEAEAADGSGATATCEVYVESKTFKVTMDTKSLSMEEGDAEVLYYTVSGVSESSIRDVVWSSSKPAVADVDDIGYVDALSEGKATIKVTITTNSGKSQSATCTVTVLPHKVVAVKGISLNHTSLTLEVGDRAELEATITPANADDPSTSCRSSDESVAKCDGFDVIAVGPGTATITVSSVAYPKIKAECKVTVKAAKAAPGTPANVKAVRNSDGSATVSWTKAANCDGYKVSYHKQGETAVQEIRVNGINSESCTIPASALAANSVYCVTVTAAVKNATPSASDYAEGKPSEEVKFSTSTTAVPVTDVGIRGALTVQIGENATLEAVVVPANATDQRVSWKSSKPEVATISDSGKVTGLTLGETTITVTTLDGGKTATWKISVKLGAPENLKGAAKGNAVTLSWDAVPGAKGYSIYYNESGQTTSQYVDAGTSLSREITGLKAKTAYVFKVYAYADASGDQAAQCTVTTGNGSAPEADSFAVSPTAVSMAAGGESKAVTITANTDWTAASSQSWLTLSKTSGTGNGSLTLKAAANSAATSRTATVSFTYGKTGKLSLNVTQQAHSGGSSGNVPAGVTFTIADDAKNTLLAQGTTSGSFVLPSKLASGNTTALKLTSNHAWTLTVSDDSWITAAKTNNAGCKLTLKNVEAGKHYSTVLTFTIKTENATCKFDLNVTLDK